MQPLTAEWVGKAEGDFVTAQREGRARKAPNYDAVCFHAQQCAEKYLKARLQEASIAIPYTHDLVVLLNLLLAVEPAWAGLTTDARALNVFAVSYRYPGHQPIGPSPAMHWRVVRGYDRPCAPAWACHCDGAHYRGSECLTEF